MKSLYESILQSTNAGRASMEERSIPRISKQMKASSIYTFFDIDLNMITWFQVAKDDDFIKIFDGPVQDLRRIRGKRYTDDIRKVGLFFNDGYLEIKLVQSAHNKYILYNWYFSEQPKKYNDAIHAYKVNWETLKEKSNNNIEWNWFGTIYSRKEGIKDRLKKYMLSYIQYTPKQ